MRASIEERNSTTSKMEGVDPSFFLLHPLSERLAECFRTSLSPPLIAYLSAAA